jgi:excisionase family DNA binding protein
MPRKSQVMASKPEPLATTEEVAAFLKDVPKHTLEQWRSQGKGPTYVKLGRHVRYRWADVYAWLEAQAVAAAG